MKQKIIAALTAAVILLTWVGAYADTGVVTAGILNVRETPYANVIGQLTYGQQVTVVGYENGWCRIQYGDKYGYVFGNYVEVTPEEVAAQKAAEALSAGQQVVEYAKNFIGVPYVYGGSSPRGFDCSGFVKYVYANFGVSLPRTSYAQMNSGYAVNIADMQPGDILVFRGGGHVGIYVGDNMYIHAPQTGRSVAIEPLNRSIIGVRRIF